MVQNPAAKNARVGPMNVDWINEPSRLRGLEAAFRMVAMRLAAAEGGVAIHASSVLSPDRQGAYVFAGPSGVGKTTSASAFGPDLALDEDFVLLLPGSRGFSRLPYEPRRAAFSGPPEAGQSMPVRAILLPQKAERFRLTRLGIVEALRHCLHLPPFPCAPAEAEEAVTFGSVTVNLATRELVRDGNANTLTTGEFALLKGLVEHARKPLSRDKLMELARGREYDVFDRSIDVQVSRLRKLVEDDPAKPRYIQTVWGFGYVFVPDGKKHE